MSTRNHSDLVPEARNDATAGGRVAYPTSSGPAGNLPIAGPQTPLPPTFGRPFTIAGSVFGAQDGKPVPGLGTTALPINESRRR
jgi:hypothetical protein